MNYLIQNIITYKKSFTDEFENKKFTIGFTNPNPPYGCYKEKKIK